MSFENNNRNAMPWNILRWTALLVAAWILPGLIGHDPWKPDEAYTFGLVNSLLHGSNWIVPLLAQEPMMEKPPLFFLSAAAIAKIFSPVLAVHDAARLASGFYMALTFGFIAATARELYGAARSWMAMLMLMSCIGIVIRSHQLITDVSLLTGFAIGFYGLALGLRRPAWGGFWLGTGVGIGFMSKGLLAPGIFGITAILLLIFPAWRKRAYGISLLAAAAAAAPWLLIWPLLLYKQSLPLFNEWLWVNNFGRFLGTNNLGPPADSAHYLRILPWYGLPVLPLALWTLWRTPRKAWIEPQVALPLTGFLVILVVLSLSADARELYAMPMLLPLALLATMSTEKLRRGAANFIYWFSVMGGGFFIVTGWFYWMALELGVPAGLHKHLNDLQPGYTAGFKALPFTLAAIYTLGWIALLLHLRHKRTHERPIIVWAATVTMLWGVVAILFVAWVDIGKSYRGMIAEMRAATPSNARCYTSRNLGEPQRAMLQYFAGIVTMREEVWGANYDCNMLLIQGDSTNEPSVSPRWHKVWEGSRPGDGVERYRLYQRGPGPRNSAKNP